MEYAAAAERVAKLCDQINDYRYHYHVLDESTMSEAAVDSLKHELTQLEEQYPELIAPNSPTQRVAGTPSSKFPKVTHSSRMLSLNDVFSRDEVQAWADRINKLTPGATTELFADTKMDGLACALVYQDSVLVQAVTRGDGTVGEDVTTNVRTIDSVPLRLRAAKGYEHFLTGRTEIRGEIVMLKQNFTNLNAANEAASKPLFMNPRNLAAGTIRQLDPKLVAARPLNFYGYDLLRDDPSEVPTNSFAYHAIRALGLAASQHATTFTTLEALMEFVNHWDQARANLPFNTDGLVAKVNDRAVFAGLGIVGKAPRAAIAYKFAAEEATTIVRDIVISIGRTGVGTPIATFDPVVVAGTTVVHASLHNADEIDRLDVRVGDTVIIYKAGDIIPKVQEVLPKLRPKGAIPFDYEAELARQYPELEFERLPGEVAYRVKGSTGPLLLAKAIQHYASRSAMNIDTLGERNVIALVKSGLAKDPADLYELKASDLEQLDRFGPVSAQKLVDGIQASKTPTLPRLIYGLGIRHIGDQTATDLVEAFGSLDALATATLEQLQAVEGIGNIVAESFLAWFGSEENQELLAKFKAVGVEPQPYHRVQGKLTGVTFVITGTLEMGTREEVAAKLEALGAKEQTSVTRDTAFLVVGENPGASKLTMAEKLGTKRLDETSLTMFL